MVKGVWALQRNLQAVNKRLQPEFCLAGATKSELAVRQSTIETYNARSGLSHLVASAARIGRIATKAPIRRFDP